MRRAYTVAWFLKTTGNDERLCFSWLDRASWRTARRIRALALNLLTYTVDGHGWRSWNQDLKSANEDAGRRWLQVRSIVIFPPKCWYACSLIVFNRESPVMCLDSYCTGYGVEVEAGGNYLRPPWEIRHGNVCDSVRSFIKRIRGYLNFAHIAPWNMCCSSSHGTHDCHQQTPSIVISHIFNS